MYAPITRDPPRSPFTKYGKLTKEKNVMAKKKKKNVDVVYICSVPLFSGVWSHGQH